MQKAVRRGREGKEGKKRKHTNCTWKKIFLRACLKTEMSHFSFICFWFQKRRKVKASLF